MSNDPRQDEDEEPGFLTKHRIALIVGAIVLVAGAVVGTSMLGGEKPKKKSASVNVVNILPPPPPPPPPTPAPTPPPQQEEPPPQEQTQEFVEESQPDSPPESQEAPQDEPPPLGSNIQGEGNDGFGLAGKGGAGLIGGTGTGRSGSGGSKFGFYAGQVQSRVVEVLRNHRKTRTASLRIQVRIWVDSTGRITRTSLSGSSGDAATDAAIRDEILTGLQLSGPPPEGMPMPIVMRITASRPN